MAERSAALSEKRESWLVIGTNRVRIPTDLHSELTRFCKRRRYSKTFDGFCYAAAVGLKVLGVRDQFHVINVDESD